MPVTTEHPEYVIHKDQWDRIADCLAGSDAVKASALKYLPMLSGQERDIRQYGIYVTRALWVGFTSRIRDALVGAIFRKAPHYTLPPRLLPREANINNAGDTVYTFSKRVTSEVIAFGRAGLLVDLPAAGDGLPYLCLYDARSIRSWRTIRDDSGQIKVDQVILFEEFAQAAADGFGSSIAGQFRVLELDEEGLYRIRLYRAKNGYPDTMGPYVNTPYMLGQMINITKQPTPSYVNATNQPAVYEEVGEPILPTPDNGKRIDFIPFYFLNTTDLRPDITKPPLLDIADVQLSHFRSSADLESARHLTAFPVPYITGLDEEAQTEWKVGGDSVWMLPQGSTVGMLEYHGHGLTYLENALDQKERYLAMLGARIIDGPKKGTETADSMRIRQGPEHATLTSIAHSVSEGMAQAFDLMAKWVGSSDATDFGLNTDFMEQPIDADTLKTLMLAVTQGLMPIDDFVWCLQRGELVRPEKTIEELRDDIEADMEKMAPLAGGVPGAGLAPGSLSAANSGQQGGANFGKVGTVAGVPGAGMGNPRKPKQPAMGGPQAPRPVVGRGAAAKAKGTKS